MNHTAFAAGERQQSHRDGQNRKRRKVLEAVVLVFGPVERLRSRGASGPAPVHLEIRHLARDAEGEHRERRQHNQRANGDAKRCHVRSVRLSAPQSPRQPDRFENDRPVHLGASLRPFDEDDGHFGDAKSALDGFPGHLHLKRIAARLERRQRQLHQCVAPPAAITRCGVADVEAGDDPDVEIRKPAEQPAIGRPVRDSSARHVPRADDEVGRRRRRDQVREVANVVREVGIHLRYQIGVERERALHPFDVRRSEAASASAMQHVDAPREARAEVFRNLAGAVRRAVVHDQHADAGDVHQLSNQMGKGLALVEGRDDDGARRRAGCGGRQRQASYRERTRALGRSKKRQDPGC